LSNKNKHLLDTSLVSGGPKEK